MRNTSLGQLFRRRREDLGWTQEELARRAGLSIRTVRKVEHDQLDAIRRTSVELLRATLGLIADDGQPGSGGADTPAASPYVAVLGPLRVSRDGWPVTPTATKLRCMLALLAIQPGQDVSRDEIADTLWPDKPPATWQNLLHTYAARLRRLWPADPDSPRVEGTAGGYRLSATARHLDVLRFVELLDGHPDRDGAGPDSDSLARALDCWRGAVCADLPDHLGQHPAAVALHRRRLDAALRYADLAGNDGEHAAVAERLGALVEIEPLHEPLHARFIQALVGSGRRAAAVETFHRIRVRLDESLGLYPGAELAAALDHALREDQEREPATPTPVVPAQLPARASTFIGRAAEVAYLDKLAASEARAATVAVIHGTAGVGKTTLAVHWARRSAHRFPDGQLYVNLRGYDPAGAALDPAVVTRAFLEALGVRPDHLPASYPAQQGLYRSLIADRRLLVVLDNARDAGQVRPLLPTAVGSMALISSRDSLVGLIATDHARPVPLDLFSLDEAREFLADRLDNDRGSTEPAAVNQLIGWCARLPLALAITAALAVTHPERPLGEVVAGMSRTGDLGAFASGDPATDLRAVFFWSYRTLSAGAARLFRHLGLHPGPSITASAAASLIGHPGGQTRVLLNELLRAHLVTVDGPGRYTLHDLLRSYAGELADTDESPTDRDAALRRVLDHYLHSAHGADRLLYSRLDAITPLPPDGDVGVESFTEPAAALAWFDAERVVLLRVIDLAASVGRHTHAWQIAWTISMFLNRRGYWQDWAQAQQAAVDATANHNDLGQAHAHRLLGLVYLRLNRTDEAHTQLRRALALFQQLGDRAGEANTERGIGRTYARENRYEQALPHTRRALDLFRSAGNRAGEASALNASGWYNARLGQHHIALEQCRQALAIQQETGDESGQANTWDSIGYAHRALGDNVSAVACYQRSLVLYQSVNDQYGKSDTLRSLGETWLDLGDREAAHGAWRAALDILQEMGHPDAAPLRARIADPAP
ncbi:BTAD domain-containing putative transcriptional regulator [Micromonospora sp. NPDC050397]|uniref:BTAD domain-containing putative transcriptional regulator n=1 Tax=Micromonospora sp. NPDC050397 TaxID=3364279 RepID=UPI00384D3320